MVGREDDRDVVRAAERDDPLRGWAETRDGVPLVSWRAPIAGQRRASGVLSARYFEACRSVLIFRVLNCVGNCVADSSINGIIVGAPGAVFMALKLTDITVTFTTSLSGSNN